ncbi:hypothetical protein [Streptomyces sp. MZ04]|uniref:hypothetical protein n=1 Tax=Streptomyces sp. MZ04 TaxID=2559236 RepID=UPI00107EC5AE|nr:hypothetical protein [Streptomyces sp. MZ04]TGB14643.1 hypothetical protein E2651_05255 [Streptomyces sp. MZ04]
MADISDELIRLAHRAEEERAQLAGLEGEEYEVQKRRWREASGLAQAAITHHATATEQDSSEVEKAVRLAVRRAEEDPAE